MSGTTMTSPVEFAASLEECYRRIGERSMRDLPIYNEALAVEAIGFGTRSATIAGILITPWFMNVILLPLDGSLASQRPGSSFSHVFPVGAIDFNVADIDGIGRIASCSLFSPMFEFSAMDVARATAEAAIAEILTPPVDRGDQSSGWVAKTVDRRSFLRGELTEPRP